MLGSTIKLYKTASILMARYQEALNKHAVKMANYGIKFAVHQKEKESITTASTTGLKNELGLVQKGFILADG